MLVKILCFFFCLQALLICSYRITISVPNYIKDNIKNNLQEHGLYVQFNTCSSSLFGKTEINDLVLYKDDRLKPYIIKVDKLIVNISLLDLLFGNHIPSNIEINGCNIFESLTGRSMPAISNLNGEVYYRNGDFIFNLRTNYDSSEIFLKAIIDVNFPFFKITPKKTNNTDKFSYNKFHLMALKYSNIIKLISSKFKKSKTEICLNINEGFIITAKTEIFDFSYRHIKFSNLVIHYELYLNENRFLNINTNAKLNDVHIEFDNNSIFVPNISLTNLNNFEINSGNNTIINSRLLIPKIHLRRNPSFVLIDTCIRLELTKDNLLNFHGGFFNNISFCYLDGSYNLLDSTVSCDFDSQFLLSNFIASNFSTKKFNQYYISNKLIHINSDNIQYKNNEFSSFNLYFNINNYDMNCSVPYNITSLITIHPEHRQLYSNFLTTIGNTAIDGYFDYNLETLKYTLQLKGECLPTDLNPFMDDWWDEIWADFSFAPDIPYGDFYFLGTLGKSKGKTTMNGFASFNRLNYRSLQAKNGSLHVTVLPHQTQISDMFIELENGQIDGELIFTRSNINEPTFLSFDINGSINPSDSKSVFGSSTEKILSRFETNSTVSIDAKGKVHINAQDSTDINSTSFCISANSDSNISFSGIEFDNLSFDLNSTSESTNVSPLLFQIADGNGSGSLLFSHDQNTTILNLDIVLVGANRRHFVERTKLSKSFIDGKSKKSTADTNNSETDGKLDFRLKASGNPEQLWSFDGNGSISVNDSNLGDIRLLGGLTDYLEDSKLPIPSGSINFKRLETPFSLHGDQVRFGNLSLSGGSVLLVANGIINLSKKILDLEARLHLLGNVTVPVLGKLIQLLDPLSAVGNIKIGGTFEKPKWSVQLRPGKSALDILFPKKPSTDNN